MSISVSSAFNSNESYTVVGLQQHGTTTVTSPNVELATEVNAAQNHGQLAYVTPSNDLSDAGVLTSELCSQLESIKSRANDVSQLVMRTDAALYQCVFHAMADTIPC